MEFKKVFRGYDPVQVNKYIAETADKEASIRRSQKERIDELSEENYNLRDRIAELQLKQNSISDALITAQAVADEMERHAKQYADKALFEAKKFYATWQAYSKTIVASFTEDELAAFMNLERKIGDVIAAYESKNKGGNAGTSKQSADKKTSDRKTTPDEFVKQIDQAAEALTAKANSLDNSSEKSEKSANPITRVEQAAGQSIDLRELTRTDESLEELCADLGLIDV